MRYIYVDNYKGFSKQTIGIDNITFLVGENSSGKTSFLNLYSSLTNKLNDRLFIRKPGYKWFDLITSNSNNQTSFTVGSYERTEVGDNLIILEYENIKEYPCFKSVRLSSHGRLQIFEFTDEGVKYGSRALPKAKLPADMFNKAIERKMPASGKILKIEHYDREFFDNLFMLLVETATQTGKEVRHIFSDFYSLGRRRDSRSIAPIRTEPKKIYVGGETVYNDKGEHVPFLLNTIFLETNKKHRQNLLKQLERYGNDSGLFKKLRVDQYAEGTALDLKVQINGVYRSLSDVGYGVSQILPILVILLVSRDSEYLIQQPEVHLHPKAQAALGEIIHENHRVNKNNFVIETHSDYLINRYRISASTSKKTNADAKILFFENHKGNIRITDIPIDENGGYSKEQTSKYRQFFMEEAIKNIKL